MTDSMERLSSRDSGNLRLCTLEKMMFKRVPQKLLWGIRNVSCSWILPRSVAEFLSYHSWVLILQHRWRSSITTDIMSASGSTQVFIKEELALSHGSASHECHVLVSNPNLFHISAFFFINNKTSEIQFCWLLCISCVLFFPQKKAFDDILTNKAPELLKDLDTFLGDKKWLVGNSVSIIFVSPFPIRLPEKLVMDYCWISGFHVSTWSNSCHTLNPLL